MSKLLCLFVILAFTACSEKSNKTLFTVLPATETGIDFKNSIIENDSTNILDYEYTFNGGGVAVADFNNDGKEDIYFTANMGSNALYLNKGDWQFENVTQAAGVGGEGRWCNGVSTVDINNDGWMDLYISASRYNDPAKRKNLLYINEGAANNSSNTLLVPHFKEAAADYGLADTSFSTQAAFFDYDNDGDLDMYLLVADKMQNGYQPNTYRHKTTDGSSAGRDRLYRNDQGHFTEIGKEAGILLDGFGLGVTITDINRDGFKDIYVSNDYLSNDLLWINDGRGHFINAAPTSFKHTSYSAMGNDVQDVNNDGLADIVTLDMLSKDNYRKKTMSPPGNYTNYIYNDFYDYDYQFVRNTFQLNQGYRFDTVPGAADKKIKLPLFSEIGLLAGMAETDWSWTPLLADFDNDGWRDLIISNGFAKDLSDRDFLAYRPMASNLLSKKDLLEQIPSVKIPDFAFRNKGASGELGFEDVSHDWGLGTAAYSNGAVYADIDHDGDLDCIMNAINGPALVYRNNAASDTSKHWLQISFKGDSLNRQGYGAMATLHSKGTEQFVEFNPARGYLSSQSQYVHLGLGQISSIDSILVTWPNGAQQLLKAVKANQRLLVDYRQAQQPTDTANWSAHPPIPLQEITNDIGLHLSAPETDFIDFNVQRLIPHKLSQYGPALAVADVNGDLLDDFVLGGAKGHATQLALQVPGGKFKMQPLVNEKAVKQTEDAGLLFFDADGDGDQDLYVVSGGVEAERNSKGYQDKLYINNGKGVFAIDTLALPGITISGMAIKAADIDNDGDLDLLRTGRVDPGHYPLPITSMLMRNDSRQGQARFTAVQEQIAPDLINAGMIADALFTDYDNDGWMDVILCREWQSLLLLHNDKGHFSNVTAGSGIATRTGWWNSITGGDFDNDGDIDYVIGNSGTNTLYQCDSAHPLGIYGGDFNKDGRFDAIPTVYFADSAGNRHEYPAFGRDEMIEQLIGLRRRYPYYREFGRLQLKDILYAEDLKDATIYHIRDNASMYMQNLGAGKFNLIPLPPEAQFAPLMALLPADINGDGNLDLLINGNDFGMDMNTGRCDALNGLVLVGNGKGGFKALSFTNSGLFIPGDGRALALLRIDQQGFAVLASQNRAPLLVFRANAIMQRIPAPAGKHRALIKEADGRQRLEEVYYGNSFLSQSVPGILLSTGATLTWQ